MSSPQVQMRRQAEAIRDAVEAIREAKPDTTYLDETLGEPMLSDEAKLAAIVAELAEAYARQEKAFGHLTDQVIASQDSEIERLQERVTALEGKPEPKAKGSRKKS